MNHALGRIGIAALTVASALTLAFTCASAAPSRHSVAIVVDGVHLVLSGIDTSGIVLESAAGDATQEATLVDRSHHRTLSVIGVPFGTWPGTEEGLPPARHGGARSYRDGLHDYRVRSGQYAEDGPTARLFGSHVPGDVSQHDEHAELGAGHTFDRSVFTAEWVTEAGSRLWIVRARQFALPSHPLAAVADFVDALGGLTVWADNSLGAPTTVVPDTGDGAVPRSTIGPSGALLLTRPPTYSDPCDADDYDRATGRRDWRNELGASLRGIPACGPRPATGAPLISAGFTSTAPSGLFQFDAVEFSMRWMYLAYGTPPFVTGGDDLFENYEPLAGGQLLFRYPDVRGSNAHPQVGDVLSYDTGGISGHTAVVTAVAADAHGDGWVDVIEQNASAHGYARLTMIENQVFSSYGGYLTGWLSPRPY